jgi:hypothetical protein
MYGGREALPDDHKFRGRRGRVRARYRRPQLGRGTEKTGGTSQRKTNLQLASGAFSYKVAPFTPAGERTKKAPSRGGRTGSNGQQHPVVIDCEVLQKRRSRCTTPGELRATRTGGWVQTLRRITPANGVPGSYIQTGPGLDRVAGVILATCVILTSMYPTSQSCPRALCRLARKRSERRSGLSASRPRWLPFAQSRSPKRW